MFYQENITIQNGLLSDVPLTFEPWLWFNNHCIRNFEIPLWNPYGAAGVPHAGNILTSLFFIPSWPIVLFGLSVSTLTFFYLTKLYLTGIFSYYYLRSIKLNFLPSLIGSIAIMFIGYNVVWLYYPNSSVLFTLPALLYFIEKITADGAKRRDLLGIGIITAQGILAGHPETFFYIGLISSAYFLFRLSLTNTDINHKLKIIKDTGLYFCLGIALSAVQLIPFLEYLLNSNAWAHRTSIGAALNWHLSILNIVPEFYGSPSVNQLLNNYMSYSYTNYCEAASGYIGISILSLAAFTLISKYRDNLVIFYALITIWAIGVVYGLPLIYDLTIRFPLLSQANNNRLLFLIGFNMAVLAAIGLNELVELSHRNANGYQVSATFKRALISSLILIAVLFSLSYFNAGFLYQLSLSGLANINEPILSAQRSLVFLSCILILLTLMAIYGLIVPVRASYVKSAAVLLLLSLVFAETGVHGMFFEPAIDDKYIFPESVPAFDLVKVSGGLYRSTSLGTTESVYPVNAQMVYGIYDIRNYDAIEIKYYWELFNSFASGMMMGVIDLHQVDRRFLDFMGVRWVFSRDNLSQTEEGLVLIDRYRGYNLFENSEAMPRAFLVQSAIFSLNNSRILDLLSDDGFDWRSSAVIYGKDRSIKYPSGRSLVNISEYKPTYIQIQIDTTEPCFLVLSDAYFPGWKAYVNGNRVDILRANYAFRAVELGGGASVVEFKYVPISFDAGALISFISMLILLRGMLRIKMDKASSKNRSRLT